MNPIRPLLLGAALALATPAFAAASDANPATPSALHGRHHRGAMLRVLRHLDLSADQRSRVRAIHDAARPRADALRETSRHNREALATTPPTEAAYAALVEQSKANAAAAIQLRSDAWSQVYAVLTPAQRAKIPELIEASRGRIHSQPPESADPGVIGPT